MSARDVIADAPGEFALYVADDIGEIDAVSLYGSDDAECALIGIVRLNDDKHVAHVESVGVGNVNVGLMLRCRLGQ